MAQHPGVQLSRLPARRNCRPSIRCRYRPGRRGQSTITALNTNFANGPVTVSFGTSDITVTGRLGDQPARVVGQRHGGARRGSGLFGVSVISGFRRCRSSLPDVPGVRPRAGSFGGGEWRPRPNHDLSQCGRNHLGRQPAPTRRSPISPMAECQHRRRPSAAGRRGSPTRRSIRSMSNTWGTPIGPVILSSDHKRRLGQACSADRLRAAGVTGNLIRSEPSGAIVNSTKRRPLRAIWLSSIAISGLDPTVTL